MARVQVGLLAPQVLPQLIPAGVLVTVPLPVPGRVTVRVGLGAKVAVTLAGVSRVTVQGPVPLQAPLQPAKKEPAAGAAVRATRLWVAKLALQVLPQLIPAGALVTLPLP